MTDAPGPRCQVCGTDIDPATAVHCPACCTPHHQDCWAYAGRCSTFGCRGGTAVTGLPVTRPADQETLVIGSSDDVSPTHRPPGFSLGGVPLALGVVALVVCSGMLLAVISGPSRPQAAPTPAPTRSPKRAAPSPSPPDLPVWSTPTARPERPPAPTPAPPPATAPAVPSSDALQIRADEAWEVMRTRGWPAAAALFESLAADGHPVARLHLGFRLWTGLEGTTDKARAVQLFQAAADAGQGEAQAYLGHALLTGEGVAADAVKARRYLELAARGGSKSAPAAAARLGYCYETGRGTGAPPDPAAAVLWYRTTGAGHPEARYRLARCLLEGRGTERATAAAIRLLEQLAADPEDVPAWHHGMPGDTFIDPARTELALCYEQGTGVPLDQAFAVVLCRQAAARGYYRAEFFLARSIADGHCGSVDPEVEASALLALAVAHCRPLAEAGDGEACAALGYAYLNGFGVPKDLGKSQSWYERSVSLGFSYGPPTAATTGGEPPR